MTTSFEFNDPNHFTTGAIGEPGARVFYLQAGDLTGHVSLKLEKQQVLALAQFLRSVLDDLPAPPPDLKPAELLQPIDAEWIVGQIAVGVDEADAEIVVMVEEAVPFDEDEDDTDDFLADVTAGQTLRVQLNAALAAAFVAKADALMENSRPPCRLCGQPEDPVGHACPRLN
ncbi:MAG: putative repeat protein (TIGR03847 family) [Acidimicrobiales bacterium]|jgi:uncharacterized repeat protein (TIGR03847 family)